MDVHDGYGVDLRAIGLDTLRERLTHDDLLPSHLPLRDNLDARLATLAALGIHNVQGLVDRLPTAKSVARLAASTGIPAEWLTLLRRHVRGYIPTPVELAEIPDVDVALVQALAATGIRNTRQLYTRTRAGQVALATDLGIAPAALDEMLELTDLARVGWIGPIGVRWFHSAGVHTVAELAAADPDALYERLLAVNGERAYTRVTLGRKDLALVMVAARRLSPVIDT